jgi:hypothetical protein
MMLPAMVATNTYMPPGSNFSLLSFGGANEATVDVNVCSASMKRLSALFTESSALTAYLCAKSREILICSANRAVGAGDRRAFSDSGFSVNPEAGGGVVAATSRDEGSPVVS